MAGSRVVSPFCQVCIPLLALSSFYVMSLKYENMHTLRSSDLPAGHQVWGGLRSLYPRIARALSLHKTGVRVAQVMCVTHTQANSH